MVLDFAVEVTLIMNWIYLAILKLGGYFFWRSVKLYSWDLRGCFGEKGGY